MTIELLFGNQNIKEDRISKMKSTSDFVDQELNFKFRPITCLFRKEFMHLFGKFFEMNEDINDETKMLALEEYEKLREAMTLQNVFEGHNQIQSNFKLKIEVDSSKILLPLCRESPVSSRLMNIQFNEAWVFNTGNLVITNDKEVEKSQKVKKKHLHCDEGYTPTNLNITQISMMYVENLQQWQDNDLSRSKQVLKDLHIKMMIMFRNNDFKFADPVSVVHIHYAFNRMFTASWDKMVRIVDLEAN